jgi:hypothetical protein
MNNNEITNDHVIQHFRSSIVEESRLLFEDYPDIDRDDNTFQEIKKLLKKWEDG